MAKPHSPLGPYQITRVRLEEIVDQDVFTAQLLALEQYEADLAVNLEYWDRTVVEQLAVRLLPILVRRQHGYQYLGSGLDVRLLREIFESDIEVLAIVLETKRVSNQVKLHALACDLLLMPPFFRTRRLLPCRNMRLWEAIASVGGTPIRGTGLHAFSRATGYSYNSLKPSKPKKASRPQSDACVQPSKAFVMEDNE